MAERSPAPVPLTSDQRARLDALVRECSPRLLGYVRRVYGRGSDAEDIVAETFCRAAGNVGALLACKRQDLYLLTIARNLCRDRFRRREPVTGDREPDEFAGYARAPDDSLADRERRSALREAVAVLPEAQREIVVLRLGTDLKFEEIAELLGLPLGTVLSRMHAAVRRLKEQFGCVYEQ